MRIDRERAAGPVIAGLGPRGFRVRDDGGEHVHAALILTPETAEDWTPPAFAALGAADADALVARGSLPEFVLLGTGAELRRPPRAFVAAVEAAGSAVEAMDSRAAARAWAVLRGEDRRIVGAFYPL